MKKLLVYLSFSLLVVVFSCNKDETTVDPLMPTQKQFAFMGELTSTTCGICGGSGHTNFNLACKNNSGKIIALAFHCNAPDDAMQSPLYSSYNSSRPSGGGIPAFYVGDYKLNYSNLQPSIDSITKRTAEAGVKFTTKIVGNVMQITAKVKFFKAVTGDYFVSFYLCESGIDGSPTAPVGYVQTGGSAGYTHPNVVRAGNDGGNAYGVKITTGTSTASGKVFNYSCNITIDPKWNKANLFVTSAIWKQNPNTGSTCRYLWVNGWDAKKY
jgi:hypothetical protein